MMYPAEDDYKKIEQNFAMAANEAQKSILVHSVCTQLSESKITTVLKLSDGTLPLVHAFAFKKLIATLSAKNKVQKIEFSNIDLSEDQCKVLLEAISKIRTLNHLNISQCFRSPAIKRLALLNIKKIIENSLTQLNLNRSALDNNDIQSLTKSWTKKHQLKSLSLRDNVFDAAGCDFIAEALQKDQCLTFLDLSNNMIKKINTFAAMLKTNHGLQTVLLNDCCIENQGITALAEALSQNTTLRTLGLENNSFDISGVAQLADALACNYYLLELKLGLPQGEKCPHLKRIDSYLERNQLLNAYQTSIEQQTNDIWIHWGRVKSLMNNMGNNDLERLHPFSFFKKGLPQQNTNIFSSDEVRTNVQPLVQAKL